MHFRKVGKFPKSLPAWEEGLWLGRATESNQHFVATSQVVHDLLESLRAKQWDPRGSHQKTNHFVLPPLGPASQGVQPLNADGSQLPVVEEEPAEEVDAACVGDPHFCGCASA